MELGISTKKVLNLVSFVSKTKIIKQKKLTSPQIIPLDETTRNEFELSHNT